MRIHDAVVDFLRYKRVVERKSNASILAYERGLKKYQQFWEHEGMDQLEEIGEQSVQYYIASFQGAKSSLNQQISILLAFHRFAFLEYQITNPTLKLHSVKKEQLLPKILSEQEVHRLLEGIDALDFQRLAIFELLYGCGLRVSEVCSLKVNDIYLEQGYIKFISKGDKQRMLPIHQKIKKAISDYFQFQRPQYDQKNSPFCFLTKKGAQLTRYHVHNMVKYEIQKQGLRSDISAHTFRHAFATHLLDGGADLRIVQELLGHENIATTQIYTHVQTKKLRAAYDAFHPRNKENEDDEI